jgi:hypothetical protein
MSSTNRSGKGREALDRYYTPDRLALDCAIEAQHLCPSPRVVLEPSVGGGAFARAARELWPVGLTIIGVDRDPEAEGRKTCDVFHNCDFLDFSSEKPDLILGNPPYREADEHIVHALEGVTPGGTVGMLLRLAFMEGTGRASFWDEYSPWLTSVHVLAERPSFTASGGRDSCAYGWFLWTRADGQPGRVYPGWRGGWSA